HDAPRFSGSNDQCGSARKPNSDGGFSSMSSSDVIYFHWSAETAAPQISMSCPNCEAELTLHQPDLDLPERILATCADCKAWFLSESQAGKLSQCAGPGAELSEL